MTKNHLGVFLDGYEEFEVGDSYAVGIRMQLGEEYGMWGFAFSCSNKKEGHSWGLAERDLKYTSRTEAINKALEYVETSESVKRIVPAQMIEDFKCKLLAGLQLSLF